MLTKDYDGTNYTLIRGRTLLVPIAFTTVALEALHPVADDTPPFVAGTLLLVDGALPLAADRAVQ